MGSPHEKGEEKGEEKNIKAIETVIIFNDDQCIFI